MRNPTQRRWRYLCVLVPGIGLVAIGCGDPLDGDRETGNLSPDDASSAVPLSEGAAFTTGTDRELERAASISLERLRPLALEAGLTSIDDLRVKRVFVDDLSMAHTHVQQHVGGVPVFGGEAIVHLRRDGSLSTVTDTLLRAVRVNPEPYFSADEALDLALERVGCETCLTAPPQVDLWVLRHEGKDHLAWRVRLWREDGTEKTSMPVIFIDAHSGEQVWEYDNLQTASGTSLYSGTVTIDTYAKSGTYYLEELGRKIGTFDNRNTTGSTYRFTDTNDVWDSSSQKAGVDAHWGAEQFHDYFLEVHGRNGIDGIGGPGYYTAADGVTKLISSKVHYGSRYNNAFWNGSYMTYGDGDGTSFSPLVSIDIVGHEMTHGITERTAELIYSGESGALNESMSDVFGAMLERYADGDSADVWKIGEACYTPSNGTGDALRYMDNPHGADNYGFTSDDDPDHYSERYTGTGDSGGVHVNSGIANKVFHLLAQGGTHHKGGSMVGIGADRAARIWYKALTAYMTSSTDFAGARKATLDAAASIYGAGSAEHNAVANAWGLCGVGSTAGGGDTGGGDTGGEGELVTNGGFEGSVDPWLGAGNAYYTANGNYAHGGTGYIYLGYYNSASGNAYQDISIPASATTASLTFWLNVNSSEGTSKAYDYLYVEVRSTAGTLLKTLATYSNQQKVSNGTYSQKGGFDLSAYKGQTVRIQFRSTTDSSYATTFRIDDVSVK